MISINELNAQLHASSSAFWTAKETPLSLLSDEEKVKRLGVVVNTADLVSVMALRAQAVIPNFAPEVDWRNRNGNHVTPVKNQGGCGSCVSFCTVATTESMASIELRQQLDLSEADLHFCSNHGANCGGWWPSDAYNVLKDRGASDEACSPYPIDAVGNVNPACATCADRDARAVRITESITLNNDVERKNWLTNVGPCSAVLHVFDDFYVLGNGVYSHVTGVDRGLHCVEVIGYSEVERCWICKNSWGIDWGDQGFFKIAYGQAGIDTEFPFWTARGVKLPAAWRRFELASAGSASTNVRMTAVSRITNSMEAWWIGADGSVQGAYWYEGSQWQRYELAPAGSASTNGGITAVSRIPNSLEVWWVGADGAVHDAYWYEGSQWQHFELAPAGSASINGGITAVSRIPNSLEAWWVRADGAVQGAYWYEGSQWQRYELAPAGSASTNGDITVVSRIPNSMEAWWIGANGSVQGAYWYEGSQWQRYELAPAGSASTNGGITAVSRIPNSLEAWWVRADGAVQGAYWYEGSQWQRYELAPAGSASNNGGIIIVVSRIPNSMEVWWVRADGAVHDAYWYEGGQWQRFELAPAGSASNNGGIMAVSRIPNSMEVWWIGADGSVQDAYWYG